MYYALKFSQETKNRLLKVFNTFFDLDDNWKIYCDHITLIHSSHKEWETASKLLYNFIGHSVQFNLISIGYNDNVIANVIAFEVNILTANEHSHITMACKNGHKPVESNQINKWEKLYCAEEFSGILTLCD